MSQEIQRPNNNPCCSSFSPQVQTAAFVSIFLYLLFCSFFVFSLIPLLSLFICFTADRGRTEAEYFSPFLSIFSTFLSTSCLPHVFSPCLSALLRSSLPSLSFFSRCQTLPHRLSLSPQSIFSFSLSFYQPFICFFFSSCPTSSLYFCLCFHCINVICLPCSVLYSPPSSLLQLFLHSFFFIVLYGFMSLFSLLFFNLFLCPFPSSVTPLLLIFLFNPLTCCFCLFFLFYIVPFFSLIPLFLLYLFFNLHTPFLIYPSPLPLFLFHSNIYHRLLPFLSFSLVCLSTFPHFYPLLSPSVSFPPSSSSHLLHAYFPSLFSSPLASDILPHV